MLVWRWDVDDIAGVAAFEISTTLDHEYLGQEMASEFARSLDAQGIETVTNMLRTRREPGRVTLLWTGEVSHPDRTRALFTSYDRVLGDQPQLG
jgi:hypothetical protein